MADRLGFEVFADDKASANLARAGKSMKALAADVELANVRMAKATKAADDAVEKYGRDSLQAREALARLAKAEDAAEVSAKRLGRAQKAAADAAADAGVQAERTADKWERLQSTVADLTAKKLKIDADIAAAEEKVDKLRQLADGATGDRKIRYDALIATAEAKIKALKNESDELRETIEIQVEIDDAPAVSAFRRIADFGKDPDFRSGISSGLRASLMIAAVGAASAVTPVISGGIIAGGAAGMIGLAAKLQKDDPKLAAAGRSLADTFTDGFRQASAGMVSPMTDALEILQRELTADLPMIQRAFDAVSGAVEPLAAGLAGAAHNALPGFVAAMQSAQPIIDVLAAELPELGAAFGDMLKTAAAMAPYAADALKVFFEVAKAGTEVMRGLMVSAVLMDQILLRQPKSWQALKDAYNGVDPDLSGLTGKFNGLTEAGKRTEESMRGVASAVLVMRGDWRGTFEAVRQAEKAIRDNGRSLDISTEAGSRNEAALDNVATAYIRSAESAKAAGKSEGEQNAIMVVGIDRLTTLYMKMGKNRPQAEALARSILGIPAVANTAVNLNKDQAQARAANYKNFLGTIPAGVGTVFRANTAPAISAIDRLTYRLNRIDGRTVSAYVRVETYGNVAPIRGVPTARAEGGILPGRPSRRDNMVVAAASGEYIVNSAQTSRHRATLEAINSGRFRGYASGGYVAASAAVAGSAAQMVHRVQLEWVRGAGDGAFFDWLSKGIRDRGGVHSVLGS